MASAAMTGGSKATSAAGWCGGGRKRTSGSAESSDFRRMGGSSSLTTLAGSAAEVRSALLSVVGKLLMRARWLSANDLWCPANWILAETPRGSQRYFLLAYLAGYRG